MCGRAGRALVVLFELLTSFRRATHPQASLNFNYRVALQDAKVKYLNVLGEIKDPHTITVSA